MKTAKVAGWLTAYLMIAVGTTPALAGTSTSGAAETEQFLITHDEIGRCGGRLVASQRAEPKTLNPIVSVDGSSREIIGLMNADLIHINRSSQKTEPALATSWTVSPAGRRYTLHLRRGVRFSDGQPFDADDVLFTFQVYLDERMHSPQRDLLIIAGKPIEVRKIDGYTVRFDLAQPYAAAERLFDSVAILPRHLLKSAYAEGKLSEQWGLTVAPSQIAGLGPFQIAEYVPGQHITLARNRNFWKKDVSGQRLPYLDEIAFVFTGNADAEAMRFEAGEIDVVSRLSAAAFSVLKKHEQARRLRLYDAGPSLEYNFLFFNLNPDISSNSGSKSHGSRVLHSFAKEQIVFRQLAFRKAVSTAIDRKTIARLVYRGRAYPLSTHVTPGNKFWVNRNIPEQFSSPAQSRHLLTEAGFSWNAGGTLLDTYDRPVTFSILFNAGNPQHAQIATLIQADLEQTGMKVELVPLEFRTLLKRVFDSREYEAAIMALAVGDADPNSEMNVWLANGTAHLWNLGPIDTQTPWEREIDRLMQQQMITLDYAQRKRVYDRVQELVWENLPVICLVSPDVLVGATTLVGNFHPGILSDYTLWNGDELFRRR